MTVQCVRPDVAELSFMLYDRALHPELFDAVGRRTISTPLWESTISICRGGHVVSFRTPGSQLTEIAGHHSSDELPTRGQRVAFRLQAGRDSTLELPGDVRVHFSSHVEQVDPAVFTELNQEIEVDARQAWLVHEFQSTQRLRPQPLSVIQVETQPESLLVHAFHTFPDNFAVLRTQSLFELGKS
jgi:hypothetical protein